MIPGEWRTLILCYMLYFQRVYDALSLFTLPRNIFYIVLPPFLRLVFKSNTGVRCLLKSQSSLKHTVMTCICCSSTICCSRSFPTMRDWHYLLLYDAVRHPLAFSPYDFTVMYSCHAFDFLSHWPYNVQNKNVAVFSSFCSLKFSNHHSHVASCWYYITIFQFILSMLVSVESTGYIDVLMTLNSTSD